ncbi:MAG: hemolysin family protein [Gemmatimonadota bacterium]|nr:hemolysin family protein [Gemmatimonadota bacterium]
MDLGLLLRLGSVLALVAANGYFVAAEFALVSARRSRIDQLVDEGDRLARTVKRAQSDLDRAISGTQLGITLASLGLGWIGEPAVARGIEPAIAGMGFDLPAAAIHTVAVVIAFSFITYLHIVLGELAPKTLALVRPETVSRYVAGPLLAFNRVLGPAIWFLNGSSQLFLKLLRLPQARHGVAYAHSPDEIEILVRQSLKEGVVEEDEQAMIEGVFELTHTVAREVMTPRTDIVAVPVEATPDEIVEAAASSGFSRLPVFEESLDRIVGIIVVKDLLRTIVQESPDDPVTAGDVMREVLFVPETKAVDDLLAELRAQKTHMAVVVDEFGGTDGLVTLEDLLEEIVGEIYDEHDVPQTGVSVHPDGMVSVDGGFSFSDLVDRLRLDDLETAEEYDTVAGYVIADLGRIPEIGDRVPLGDVVLEVAELADRRITRLDLHGVPDPAALFPEEVLEGE